MYIHEGDLHKGTSFCAHIAQNMYNIYTYAFSQSIFGGGECRGNLMVLLTSEE
jgi:hypothetical protein